MDATPTPSTPEHVWIEDRIPSLHWAGSSASPKSAVIYMTGGGGTKEDVALWIVEQVTAAGVDLYSIDLPGHGERQPMDWAPKVRPSLQDYLDLTDETIEDIRSTVQYIREDAGTDERRIGVRAISLSASVALAAIAAGVEIDACLSICGSGDHAATAAFRAQRDGLTPAEVERELMEHLERLMRIQPLGKAGAFAHCSVLMIHGAADQLRASPRPLRVPGALLHRPPAGLPLPRARRQAWHPAAHRADRLDLAHRAGEPVTRVAFPRTGVPFGVTLPAEPVA